MVLMYSSIGLSLHLPKDLNVSSSLGAQDYGMSTMVYQDEQRTLQLVSSIFRSEREVDIAFTQDPVKNFYF